MPMTRADLGCSGSWERPSATGSILATENHVRPVLPASDQVDSGSGGAYAAEQLRLSHRSDGHERLMQDTKLTLKCTPDQNEAHVARLDAHYLTSKPEGAFGFRPKMGSDTRLAMSIAWLNHHGMGRRRCDRRTRMAGSGRTSARPD